MRVLGYLRLLSGLRGNQLAVLFLRKGQRFLDRLLPRDLQPQEAAFVPRGRDRLRAVADAIASSGILQQAQSEDLACGFSFAGTQLPWEDIDLLGHNVSDLWTFHLHYFAEAPSLAQQDDLSVRVLHEWVDRWIGEACFPQSPGWHPYPTSVRIENWLLAAAVLASHGKPRQRSTLQLIMKYLPQQLEYLSRRTEDHLSGNHLVRNALALWVGGSVLRVHGAEKWRKIGGKLLEDTASSQVLSDGMHYERSPMYHGEVLRAYLIASFLDEPGSGSLQAVQDVIPRMLKVMVDMQAPDGHYCRFNDSADGVVPPPIALRKLASRLGWPVPEPAKGITTLPASGYGVYRGTEDGCFLVFDFGRPGASEQPGHVHCDALSIELFLGDSPFFVNSGVSGYGGEALRVLQRSTAGHNTVVIDQRNQSEIWSTFRTGRMAHVEGEVGESMEEVHLSGSCRYFGLPHVTHSRLVVCGGGSLLQVTDQVQGARHSGRAYFRFAPGWEVRVVEDVLFGDNGELRVKVVPFGFLRWQVVQPDQEHEMNWFGSGFGLRERVPLFIGLVSPEGGEFGIRVRWAPVGSEP